ncbi:MAG: hypothetical protein NTZ56_04405 [Acidobacteria bacterium]|nr:hypothetical protein [Acidobacteriota bacterium]
MPEHLEFLIAEARKYQMSSEESEAQIKSFAYGNVHFENEAVTRQDIDSAKHDLDVQPPVRA